MLTRRGFNALLGTGLLCALAPRSLAFAEPAQTRFKAVAFDAFTVFNPHNIAALAEELFPGKGAEFYSEWRTRQFDYSWLRVVAHDYADFWQVTEDALLFATEKLGLSLQPDARSRLMNAYLEMPLWPDVREALSKLKEEGLKLAFLTNLSTKMIDGNLEHAGIGDLFAASISTDRARTYKPDPLAYELGPRILRLDRKQILFVAFAGWDAAGAKRFGYPTFWLNRTNQPAEHLGVAPDAVGREFADLLKFLKAGA